MQVVLHIEGSLFCFREAFHDTDIPQLVYIHHQLEDIESFVVGAFVDKSAIIAYWVLCGHQFLFLLSKQFKLLFSQ